MSLSLNFNLPAARSAKEFTETQNAYTKSSTQLATGKRIVSASDDAAGAAIVTKLELNASALVQADRNAAQAQAFLQTAEGGITQINNFVTRLKELAAARINAAVSDDDAVFINSEYKILVQTITDTANKTRWNGESLLNGESGGGGGVHGEHGFFSFQIGENASDIFSVDLSQPLDSYNLGLTSDLHDVTDAAGAQAQIAGAVDKLNSVRGNIGASANALGLIRSRLTTSLENTRIGIASLDQADISVTVTQLTSNTARLQAQNAMILHNNQQTALIASLITQQV